jgi:hypothetical protein
LQRQALAFKRFIGEDGDTTITAAITAAAQACTCSLERRVIGIIVIDIEPRCRERWAALFSFRQGPKLFDNSLKWQ